MDGAYQTSPSGSLYFEAGEPVAIPHDPALSAPSSLGAVWFDEASDYPPPATFFDLHSMAKHLDCLGDDNVGTVSHPAPIEQPSSLCHNEINLDGWRARFRAFDRKPWDVK